MCTDMYVLICTSTSISKNHPYVSIFQLNEPISGGATVFPKLNLTLYPSKSDAVFWYNLHKNGERDERTLHAGCPILAGSKWGTNLIMVVLIN